jgi:hypothetical protein
MAAGLGFKTFTTGEVLTAADTNGYLMQGVLVFASSAARAAAITSPQEGQYSYLKDTNSTEYYDGAAWIAAPIGDITGVTAGVGITGGGTSGTVTVTNDMATTITAAGDIVVGTGSGTYDNLPIGTTAQVLTADTTVSPYKVKWATPASGSTFAGAQATNNGGTFSYTTNVATALPFPTESYDTNSFHDTSTNTTRLTIPTGGGGKYLFTGTGIFIGTVPTYAWIMVYKNGAVISDGIAYAGRIGAIIGNSNAPVGGSVVLSAVAGDYFELFIQSDQSTGTKNIYGSFSCSFLGA